MVVELMICPIFTNQIDIADVIIQYDNNLSASFSANRASLYPLRRFELFDSNLSLSLDLQNRSFTRSLVEREGDNNKIKSVVIFILTNHVPLGRS